MLQNILTRLSNKWNTKIAFWIVLIEYNQQNDEIKTKSSQKCFKVFKIA